MALILEMMATRKHSLDQILAGIPKYYSAGCKVPCSSSQAVDVLRRLSHQYADLKPTTTDGLRLDWDDAWALIRASNTEPFMRIFAEARSQEKAEELVARFKAEIGA